jgi:hypothetical protein
MLFTMTHYFIKEGKIEEGPFTLDELREKPVEKHTQVWFAGLKEWTSVEHVYELKHLFHKKTVVPNESPNAFVNLIRRIFLKKNEQPAFKIIS